VLEDVTQHQRVLLAHPVRGRRADLHAVAPRPQRGEQADQVLLGDAGNLLAADGTAEAADHVGVVGRRRVRPLALDAALLEPRSRSALERDAALADPLLSPRLLDPRRLVLVDDPSHAVVGGANVERAEVRPATALDPVADARAARLAVRAAFGHEPRGAQPAHDLSPRPVAPLRVDNRTRGAAADDEHPGDGRPHDDLRSAGRAHTGR
jgi:hypothetical protein